MTARSHLVAALLYDPIIRMAERHTFANLRSQLLAPLRGDVLEIGAGTGLSFSHYSPDANVLALEPDPAMFKRARKKLRATQASIVLEPGGDERMSTLPSASFDAIVFALVLCTIEEPQRTLAQAKRLLRPGGKLVILEHVRSDGRLGIWQDRLRPIWERFAGGCQLNRNTRGLLAYAGFDVTALRDQRIRGGIIQDILVGTVTL